MAITLGGSGHDDAIQGAAPIPAPTPTLVPDFTALLDKVRAARNAAADSTHAQDWVRALDHLTMAEHWVKAAEVRR